MHLDFGTSKLPLTKTVIDFFSRADLPDILRFIPDLSFDFNNLAILLLLPVLILVQVIFLVSNVQEAAEKYSKFTSRAFSTNQPDFLIFRNFEENIIVCDIKITVELNFHYQSS